MDGQLPRVLSRLASYLLAFLLLFLFLFPFTPCSDTIIVAALAEFLVYSATSCFMRRQANIQKTIYAAEKAWAKPNSKYLIFLHLSDCSRTCKRLDDSHEPASTMSGLDLLPYYSRTQPVCNVKLSVHPPRRHTHKSYSAHLFSCAQKLEGTLVWEELSRLR